jgi:Virulence factor BrkB
VYGSLAGVIIFMIWMWISNVAILMGAEFNAELERGAAAARTGHLWISRTASIPVVTSVRRTGRAPRSFSSYLRALGTVGYSSGGHGLSRTPVGGRWRPAHPAAHPPAVRRLPGKAARISAGLA